MARAGIWLGACWLSNLKQGPRAVEDAVGIHARDPNAIGPGLQAIGLRLAGRHAGNGRRKRQGNIEARRGVQVVQTWTEVFSEHRALGFQDRVLDVDLKRCPQQALSREASDCFGLRNKLQRLVCLFRRMGGSAEKDAQ